ncbi:unnamed protein product [Cylindrotheca closterium]|uniref:Uncharacterized protein n=1 Tax=Cylindrotheca closterium TaxID=2856 RepID=A0AAD2FGC0_9STRA|nr:unnamed protein product [Cylindrotheca closterium]
MNSSGSIGVKCSSRYAQCPTLSLLIAGLFDMPLGMESGISAAARHTNGQGPFAQPANTGTCGRPLYPEPCLPPMGHITHYDSHWVPGLILWRTGIGCCHQLQASSTGLGQPGKHFSPEGSSVTSRRFAPLPSHSSSPWWTAPLPTDVLCAMVRPITGSDSVLLTGAGCFSETVPNTSPSILQAWQTAAELYTDYYGWVPDKIEIHGDEAILVAALLKGRLCVISDGSFKDELGTAAVQLLVKHGGSDRITIRYQTPGLPQDQSPYRSELIGLMAGIMAIDWLLQQWAPNLLTCPRVRIACDGLSATEMAFERLPTFSYLSSIWEAILRSSVNWSSQPVYGHLDKSNLFDKLSWLEKRNLEVDGKSSHSPQSSILH